MIKQLFIRFLLLIRFVYNAVKQRFAKPIVQQTAEKTHEEIYAKTIDLYCNTPNEEANQNIVAELYDKDARKELLKTEDNPTEKQWSSRILMESTRNSGNIIMYYDCFKTAFVYYSDNQSLSNKDLFYAAMKYVVKYRCRDFLIDPKTYPNNKMIELLKQEDKQLQTKTASPLQKQQQQQKKQPNKRLPEKNLFRTNFARIGKLCEFNILQKPRDKKIMLVNQLMFNNKPLTTMTDFFDELDITEKDTLFTPAKVEQEQPLAQATQPLAQATQPSCTDRIKPNSYAEWKKLQQQQQ